jgi:hypothetical protein
VSAVELGATPPDAVSGALVGAFQGQVASAVATLDPTTLISMRPVARGFAILLAAAAVLIVGARLSPEGLGRGLSLLVHRPSRFEGAAISAVLLWNGNALSFGVIAGDNSLDFKMLLKLSGGASNMLGSLTGLSASTQNKGLPFLIEGKTSNPVFRPALGGAVAGSIQDSLLGAVSGNKGKTDAQGQQKPDLKDALGGLFNKKKKPQQ